MPDFWNKQIARADYRADESSGSKELLTFYAQLLRAQEETLFRLIAVRRLGN